ncbi:hypothetical protein MCNS_36800 [Mycobacterium conspicuum]|uniref:Uncharacterized protein n=1 Tax=Mycobacterium conspicuum TaxID=44010 RepID=A0A7I7YGY4_9MYCO|nr:hypothetical protein MCNS_36800 [Mycobacterium conspicuum]
MPGAGPDQVLVPAGEDLDRLGFGAVAGHRAVVVPVGADQIGQQLGVGSGVGKQNCRVLGLTGATQ